MLTISRANHLSKTPPFAFNFPFFCFVLLSFMSSFSVAFSTKYNSFQMKPKQQLQKRSNSLVYPCSFFYLLDDLPNQHPPSPPQKKCHSLELFPYLSFQRRTFSPFFSILSARHSIQKRNKAERKKLVIGRKKKGN